MGTMKASELRIGNYVLDRGEFSNVFQIDDERVNYSARITEIEGIPLDEEWLIKLGFEKDTLQNDIWYFVNHDFVIIQYPDKRLSWDQKVDLLFVHQLQNLFYSLSGEELTIKE